MYNTSEIYSHLVEEIQGLEALNLQLSTIPKKGLKVNFLEGIEIKIGKIRNQEKNLH